MTEGEARGDPGGADRRRSRILRSVYAAALLIAAANHLRMLIEHGLLWDYGGVPWPSAAYWTSLTLLDPIAAFLLFSRPRLGILATIAIIIPNVAHNIGIMAAHVPAGRLAGAVASSAFVMCQIGFMLFVVATAQLAWKGAAPARAAGA